MLAILLKSQYFFVRLGSDDPSELQLVFFRHMGELIPSVGESGRKGNGPAKLLTHFHFFQFDSMFLNFCFTTAVSAGVTKLNNSLET